MITFGYKLCPYCGEEIRQSAVKCQYCREFLNKETIQETRECPYCLSELDSSVTTCPYCGESLDISLLSEDKNITKKNIEKITEKRYNKMDNNVVSKFKDFLGIVATKRNNIDVIKKGKKDVIRSNISSVKRSYTDAIIHFYDESLKNITDKEYYKKKRKDNSGLIKRIILYLLIGYIAIHFIIYIVDAFINGVPYP